MVTIAVTGASGAVGTRVVAQLVERGLADRVVALDRARFEASSELVEAHRVDLMTAELEPIFDGCDSIIHLAEDGSRRTDHSVATTTLDRVLAAAESVGCSHVVLLSSALVYGAYPDNPVPLVETHEIRPIPTLDHAVIKAGLEDRARMWAQRCGGRLAVLRPAATLSEETSSWIGAALRAAAAVRSEQIDPPVQFLHHNDLVEALVVAVEQRLDSTFNVAPDGWIGAEMFRSLRGEADVRLPEKLGEWRLRAAKAVANRTLLDGLEPYVSWPWVVANDKLRATGWEPKYTNEETYVLGTTSPLLSSVPHQRRQEIALGAAGAAGMAVVGATLFVLRKTLR